MNLEIQLSKDECHLNEHRGFLDVRPGDLAIRILETTVVVASEEECLPAALSDILQIKPADLQCRISLSLLIKDRAEQELPAIQMNLLPEEAMRVACALPGDWETVKVAGKTSVAVGPVSCGQDETVQALCKYSFTSDDQDEVVQSRKMKESEALLIVALRKRLCLQVTGHLRQIGERRCEISISACGDLGIAPRYVRAGSAELEELRAAAVHHLSQDDHMQALTNFKATLALEQQVREKFESDKGSTTFPVPKDIIQECAGDARTAITWHQEALAVKVKRLGQTMPNAAGSLLSLGDDYVKFHDYDNAIAHYRRALAIHGALDPMGADTAKTLHSIATALELKGSLGEALETYSESLTIRKELHPRIFADQGVADSLCGIASVHARLQEYQKAIELYTTALNLRERSNGPGASETAATLMDLGNIYLRMGSHRWALDSFRRAFTIYQKVFGLDHGKTAAALHYIGMVHSSLGQYSYAMEYYSRALRTREQDESLRTEAAMTLNNIGVVLSQMGEYQLACTYHQRAYNIQKVALGSEHSETLATMKNLQKANQAWQQRPAKGSSQGVWFGLFDLTSGSRNCSCRCMLDEKTAGAEVPYTTAKQNMMMEEVISETLSPFPAGTSSSARQA